MEIEKIVDHEGNMSIKCYAGLVHDLPDVSTALREDDASFVISWRDLQLEITAKSPKVIRELAERLEAAAHAMHVAAYDLQHKGGLAWKS